MQDAARRLAQLEKLLDCYHQAVGHELPNQLVALQGLSKLLLQRSEALAPETRDLLARLADQAKRADRTVRSMAEFGRIVRAAAAAEPVALTEVWAEASLDAQRQMAPVLLQFEASEQLPIVRAPRDALRRALSDLLVGRARQRGDVECLRTRLSAQTSDDGQTEIRIEDNAPAPTPAQQVSFETMLARALIVNWGGIVRCEPGLDQCCVTSLILPPAEAQGRS